MDPKINTKQHKEHFEDLVLLKRVVSLGLFQWTVFFHERYFCCDRYRGRLEMRIFLGLNGKAGPDGINSMVHALIHLCWTHIRFRLLITIQSFHWSQNGRLGDWDFQTVLSLSRESAIYQFMRTRHIPSSATGPLSVFVCRSKISHFSLELGPDRFLVFQFSVSGSSDVFISKSQFGHFLVH